MICPPCKEAGQVSTAARQYGGSTRLTLLSEARKAHRECLWPESCPCRHQVGPCTAKDTEVPK